MCGPHKTTLFAVVGFAIANPHTCGSACCAMCLGFGVSCLILQCAGVLGFGGIVVLSSWHVVPTFLWSPQESYGFLSLPWFLTSQYSVQFAADWPSLGLSVVFCSHSKQLTHMCCVCLRFVDLWPCRCRVEDYWHGYKQFCYAYYSHSLAHESEFRESKSGASLSFLLSFAFIYCVLCATGFFTSMLCLCS